MARWAKWKKGNFIIGCTEMLKGGWKPFPFNTLFLLIPRFLADKWRQSRARTHSTFAKWNRTWNRKDFVSSTQRFFLSFFLFSSRLKHARLAVERVFPLWNLCLCFVTIVEFFFWLLNIQISILIFLNFQSFNFHISNCLHFVKRIVVFLKSNI